MALYNLGRYEEAIKSYEKVLEIYPDNDSAWYKKACSYSLQDQTKPAIQSLQKAIQLNSDENIAMAKTESDFDNIRADQRFQRLIQPGLRQER